ncbi:MAG TPA: hypothetical protein VE913_16980 [Longimicrobium sp.]|nr:hypothetical protein [Longimicrobium sp.]
MAKYYVNNNVQANGDHEVHVAGCTFMPLEKNRTALGEFTNCADAVRAAKGYHTQVNGCKTCSKPCHTA